MDHSEGVQIPEGLLPGVSVLKPGIALCLKHSQVDKRYIDSHVEQLDRNLPSELYPSFQVKDTANGQLSDALHMLRRLRADALRGNRVYFLYSPFFAARLPALIEEVDHLFYYTPGLYSPMLITEKLNGERIPQRKQAVMMIQRTPKRAEVRKMLHVTLPEGIDAEEASRVLSEALAARYGGRIDIETVDTNEQ